MVRRLYNNPFHKINPLIRHARINANPERVVITKSVLVNHHTHDMLQFHGFDPKQGLLIKLPLNNNRIWMLCSSI